MKKISEKTDVLGTESIGKLLFRLSLPTIVAQVINLLYNLVDRMYIGHIEVIGKDALTGVGVTLPLIMIITAFAALVGMGAAPRASIFLGKGDNEQAEKALGNALTLLIIFSVFLTILFQFYSRKLLMAFGASENTISYSLDYILIYSLGTIFVLLTLGMNAFISAQGFAKVGMITVLIGAVLNIILDPIFIFALNMGVRGAALATIISQGVSMSWTLLFLTSNRSVLRIRLRYMKLSPQVFLPGLALGLAPFIMQSTESLIAICFNRSLLKYGGDLAVGTMTILTSVMQMSMLPLLGLCQGAQPIMSYNYGARNAVRVRRTFRLLLISCLVYSTVLWAAVQLFPRVFILIFNSDPKLIEFGIPALRLYMAVSLIFGIQIACQQSFISLGDAKSSLAAALMRKIIILIPMIYVLPATGIFRDKTTAVFASEPISDFLAVTFTSILFIFRFRKFMGKISHDTPETTHTQSRYFRFLRKAIRLFTPKMETIWQEPFSGNPSIFVCNHDRAFGPIAMNVHFDLCEGTRPWINAQVLSHRNMPAYVRQDYWWDPEKWYSPIFDYTMAYVYSLIIPTILKGSDCVPVYHDGRTIKTLRGSIKYLNDGMNLLLFPERPTGYHKYGDDLYDGFVSVAKLYYRRTGKRLDFYPTYVDYKHHTITVASPLTFNPNTSIKEETQRVCKSVQEYFNNEGKLDKIAIKAGEK